eukprot:937169-Pelagomonas_calceolata.AAC.6
MRNIYHLRQQAVLVNYHSQANSILKHSADQSGKQMIERVANLEPLEAHPSLECSTHYPPLNKHDYPIMFASSLPNDHMDDVPQHSDAHTELQN